MALQPATKSFLGWIFGWQINLLTQSVQDWFGGIVFLSNSKDDFVGRLSLESTRISSTYLYNNQKHPKRTRAGGKFVHLHFGSSLERNKQLELTWTESTFEGSQKNIFDVREIVFGAVLPVAVHLPKGGHSS